MGYESAEDSFFYREEGGSEIGENGVIQTEQ